MMIRNELLKSILSQPSAPFREHHVIQVITHELRREGVPHFLDPVGNILIGASSKAEYLRLLTEKTEEPLRIFVAHMDHPGFIASRWRSPTELEVKWHGGSPSQHVEGAPVWLADREGPVAEGHMRDVKLIPSGRAIESAIVEVPFQDRRKAKASEIYGGFRFRAPVWEEGDLIYTKAADDLVGSFAVTTLALELLRGTGKKSATRKKRAPFLGLLTRAEEVGFIGAIGHLELGWLKKAKRPLVFISLETSRALPGAEIGKGPVVRLGDRFTVFDAGSLRIFSGVADSVLAGKYQKRVMDGGTCEGTTAMVYGLPTLGISVPLGNYHNQSFEGGPDSAGPMGPAPEFVHRQDIEGLITLCHGLLKPKLTWRKPWADKAKEFKKMYRDARELLRSGP